jgi:iron complex outermembrane receptor protein
VSPYYETITGDRNFQPEELNAYQIGTRVQPMDALSFSVSTFYNVYNNLRSVDLVQTTKFPFVISWGNNMDGDVYGVEAWGNYQVVDWWRLAAGYKLQHEDFRFKPGSDASTGPSAIAAAGDDPHDQASLQSSMNLGSDVTWEDDLRYVDKLPNPVIPAYVELNSRLAWSVTKSLQLSIAGFNLLQKKHLEYEEAGATIGDEVERSFYVETKWRF